MSVNISTVFIIGAGRSGTNILRDSLNSLSGMVTWPCDEINLIFRHGNRSVVHDEFGAEHAHGNVKKYIQREFEKLRDEEKEQIILEKTCANSLRVPFLNEIFPEARFIFIYRNGYDVTASAKKRWRSSIEPGYLLKKLKYVPKGDIPYYTLQFMMNRLKQLISSDKRMGTWGPVYKGMKDDLNSLSLEEICAKQWARCVSKASTDLSILDSSRAYSMSYESFVNEPAAHIAKIGDWLGMDWRQESIKSAVSEVRAGSVGKGIHELSEDKREDVRAIVEPVMNQLT